MKIQYNTLINTLFPSDQEVEEDPRDIYFIDVHGDIIVCGLSIQLSECRAIFDITQPDLGGKLWGSPI